MTILQNMTSSKGDRSHSNHVTSKAVICYICGKVVKDCRLSSHLLFGSLQCRACNLKFRYCRDFSSFQRSRNEKKSDLCAHQVLRWTRDPAEYLKRKLRIDIVKSKPDKYQASTKEVKKALFSYVCKLKPIQHKSPWNYAIEKLKKFTSSKNNISRDYEREEKIPVQNNHFHQKEKEKSTRTDDFNQTEREPEVRGKENCTFSENLPEKIADENCQVNLNCTDVDSVDGNFFSIGDVYPSEEIVSYDEVPRYSEEIVIPQSEWELDVISGNDDEDCNKSVELYLTSGDEKSIPFIVEEVIITEHEESDHVTLSVDESDCCIESESESTLYSNETPFIEYTENGIQSVVEICTEGEVTEDLYDEIPSLRAKVPEDIQCENLESSESFLEKDLESSEKFQRRTCTEQQIFNKGLSIWDKELFVETGENVSHGNNILSENCMSDTKKHDKSKEIQTASSSRELKKNKLTRDSNNVDFRNKLHSKRKSPSMIRGNQMPTNKLYCRTRQQHKRRVNDSKSTKYNLRSRKSKTINSFLQNLDCSKKRKLWQKLIPTVKKLKKLKAQTGDSSLPSFFLPLQSNEYDDDFMVDVLLSWFLSTKHLKNKVSSSSSSSSSNDDDNNDSDYNGNDKSNHSCNETATLLKNVKKTLKEFSSSIVSSSLNNSLASSKSGVSECASNVKGSVKEAVVERRGKKPQANHLTLDKRHQVKGKKTFYVNPPSDGFYYIVSYPSQPLITECPMCYFRVFPSMFSLNLVTNLATTKCVGCMLTIYVVQEPDESNSIPKIIFRNEDLPENKQNAPRPGRYKDPVSAKLHKKVSVRSFFKQ